ncbi:sigma-70 family RNA polymerase sigma factor [Pedobacter immunditicola]|uniref:sigma-70 family RNA polymerase sigma factor n=1 Tax=Pedobacter immunditicola TaxID=3133440 RepID=UPI0030AE4E85
MQSESISLWCDQDLLDAIKADDRSAFEIIYNKYWSRLYLSAYNILRDKQIAEDIIQDIFVQLWFKRSKSNIENLNSYLYTSVRFQVFKTIRDGKVKVNLMDHADQLIISEDIESAIHLKEVNRRLEESIELLPQKCKEIYILNRKQYLSAKDIALRLNLSPKTIENQLTIAFRRIRSSMADLL